MKKYPWKQRGCLGFRYWVAPNSLRAFEDDPDTERKLDGMRRRYAALMRLVLRGRV